MGAVWDINNPKTPDLTDDQVDRLANALDITGTVLKAFKTGTCDAFMDAYETAHPPLPSLRPEPVSGYPKAWREIYANISAAVRQGGDNWNLSADIITSRKAATIQENALPLRFAAPPPHT